MRVFGVPLLGGILEDMLVSRYTATVAKVCVSPLASPPPPRYMAPLPTWGRGYPSPGCLVFRH